MTTQRQARSNNKNAQKSAGPKTQQGKSTSSRNARKHGLNTKLSSAMVLKWFRVILNDEVALPGPLETDDRLQAAHRLAEAEARLTRARNTEANLLNNDFVMPGEYDAQRIARATEDLLIEKARYGEWDKECDTVFKELVQDIRERKTAKAKEYARQVRIIKRYCAEAESQRRKAVKRWAEVEILWRKGLKIQTEVGSQT